jgi:hypothetical protein
MVSYFIKVTLVHEREGKTMLNINKCFAALQMAKKAFREAVVAMEKQVELDPLTDPWVPSENFHIQSHLVRLAENVLKSAKTDYLALLEQESSRLYEESECCLNDMHSATGLRRLNLSFKSVSLKKEATRIYETYMHYRDNAAYDY